MMTRSQHPKKDDTGKTKQQLIDELQKELTQLRHSEELLSGILDIASDAFIEFRENKSPFS